jgi:ribosome-associated protein
VGKCPASFTRDDDWNREGTLNKQPALGITARLSIPEDELIFTSARSSGPGGQNVNKVSTRVTLWFDVLRSPSLSEVEKRLILNVWPTRINKAGWLRVTVQQTRSQANNRALAVSRFRELLSKALVRPKRRIKTRIPWKVWEERIDEKKRHSRLKAGRAPILFEKLD